MKIDKKLLVLTSLIILLPVLLGCFFWSQLPKTIATHFDLSGQANGFSSRLFAVFGLPFFLLLLHWFCLFMTSKDPKANNVSSKMHRLIYWIIPLVSCFVMISIYGQAFGYLSNHVLIANLLIGILLITIGNYMPKNKQNAIIGVRNMWTLKDEIILLTSSKNNLDSKQVFPVKITGLFTFERTSNELLCDTDKFNSKTDKLIFKNFDSKTLKNKVQNKLKFQEELALEVNENIPMIGMVTRLTHQKGIDLVLHVADEILKTGAQLVILGTGDRHYEDALRSLEYRRHDKVRSLIMFSSEVSSKVYSSCDMFLMPSKTEPCGLSQLISMRYATVPIVHRVGGLRDTVEPFDGNSGTGFTFESFDAYDMLDAVYRATYCYYQERHIWNKIMKNAIKQDVSWKKSALQYIDMYNEIV